MADKNDINKITSELTKGTKMIALVAPSFVIEFQYPKLITQLRKLGFDKVTELTFGAKLVNREYHKLLEKSTKKLIITTPCPGVVELIKKRYPKYKKNLALVDSPVVAMAKVCKKYYPKHKTVFLSPCDYKKIEASKTKYIDYVVDYEQLHELIKQNKLSKIKVPKKELFDKFYNDYTKIYPLSGGLAKTAKVKDILKKDEIKIIDGVKKIMKFLDNPDPKIKFLDVLFCDGGCIGGPRTTKKLSIPAKRKKVMDYLKKSSKKNVPEDRKGVYDKAKGLKFKKKSF
jgi:iron only hydrogenase large subunit-like protein